MHKRSGSLRINAAGRQPADRSHRYRGGLCPARAVPPMRAATTRRFHGDVALDRNGIWYRIACVLRPTASVS